MSIDTLINDREVVTLGGLNKDFPTCSVTDIWHIEQSVKYDCLGEEFYIELLGDKKDYSKEANEWDASEKYLEGDVVIYQGVYYIAIASNSATLPTNTTYWDLAPKFNNAYYNELWQFLGRYIASKVARMTIQPVVTPITGQGAIKREGETFSPAGFKDINSFYAWLDAMATAALRNMDKYLDSKKDETDAFDLLLDFRGLSGCNSSSGDCPMGHTTRYNVY